MNTYKKHPLNILPNCKKGDYDRLQSSIRTNGFDPKFPILLFEGEILDGWQRYQVCTNNNIEFITVGFDGGYEEALIFVQESNIRRNLTDDQIAAFIIDSNGLLDRYKAEARERSSVNLKQNRSRSSSTTRSEEGLSLDKAATDFGTTGGKIRRAEKLKKASPKVFEEVKSGEKKLYEAEKEVFPSKKIIKPKTPPTHNGSIKKVHDQMNSVADGLQYILQGDHKPITQLDWGYVDSIKHSLYDIVRLAASFGVDVEKIVKTLNGNKKINAPKHLQKPKNIKATDIEYEEVIN